MDSGNINISENDVKVGEFLVQNGIITSRQLDDALEMQKDNPTRLVGEILVTQGILTKEDMIMALEMFLLVTERPINHVNEWLDQEEIDMLMKRISSKDAKSK